MASLTKNRRATLERIEKFISPRYFTDINLYGRLYPQKTGLPTLLHFDSNGRIPFKEAMEIGNFTPTKVGSSFGPTWTTHWFKVSLFTFLYQYYIILINYINKKTRCLSCSCFKFTTPSDYYLLCYQSTLRFLKLFDC